MLIGILLIDADCDNWDTVDCRRYCRYCSSMPIATLLIDADCNTGNDADCDTVDTVD